MRRVCGLILIFISLLAGVGEFFALHLPTVHIVFAAREIPWLGWAIAGTLCVLGFFFIVSSFMRETSHPVTARKLSHFRRTKTGVYSLVVLMGLAMFSCLDHLLVGNEALVTRYDEVIAFPAFTKKIEMGDDYGLESHEVPNYRELNKAWKNNDGNDGWMILPLWPYAAKGDPLTEEASFVGMTSEGGDAIAALYQGLQVNFHMALVYLPLVTLIGIVVGLSAGYFGGVIDFLIQRVLEVISYVPGFLLVVLLVTQLFENWRGQFLYVLLAVATVGWVKIASDMRMSVKKERGAQYMIASRSFGASRRWIILRHLLPNSVSAALGALPMTFVSLVVSLVSLDFLGLGLAPQEFMTWGTLLRESWQSEDSQNLTMTTLVIISLFLLLIVMVSEAVREAFTPTRFSSYR